MKTIAINQLPLAVDIPTEEEFIAPIYRDNTVVEAMRSIKMADLIEYIKNLATEDGEVTMEIVENGIKFKKLNNE